MRAEHDACGGETRVRLPGHLPAATVRRVICQSCAQSFDAPAVEEVELLEPAPVPPPEPRAYSAPPAVVAPAPPAHPPSRVPRSLPALPAWVRDPGSRGWRYLSIVAGAIAVIVVLMVIRGSDEPATPFSDSTAQGADTAVVTEPIGKAGGGAGAGSGSLVRESSFAFAMPPGWQRTSAAGGATFAASAGGGEADATLWVKRDPQLSFADFEARSLDQLRSLAGSARVTQRVAAPTAEGTVVELAADAPEGSPAYEVTLRSSGPYRYYLSTTVQPDASRAAADGAELIHGSFVPTGARGG